MFVPNDLSFTTQEIKANALVVSGLTVNQAAGTVTFTVQWQNGWKVTTVPNNWDGAWLFVKFRDCGVSPSTQWSHGTMSTTLGDHTFNAAIEPILSDGSAVGIDAAPNNTGVMIRHVNNGVYPTAGPYSVTLRVSNLPATGNIDVKIFGVEMVYVPQGAYFAGDGTGSTTTYYNFGGQQITSENAVAISAYPAPGWAVGNVNVPAAFPKGFKPFHCMKYEISEGQYAEFLNTISSTIQNLRYPNAFNSRRNRLGNFGVAPNIYTTDRENRAQNYLAWSDVSAYLDWAALRPMTELEYEKACRGQGPVVANEYAWGTATITQLTTISTTAPSENGTEVAVNVGANCNYAMFNLSGGDGGYGPVRCGLFATPLTSTRQASGATYYGIMEMTGNVWEMTILVASGGINFTNTWGDGNIDNTTGLHNTATWPAGNTPNNLFDVGCAGGGYDTQWDRSRTSDRYERRYSNTNGWFNNRSESVGGRGVR